jgi:glycosyltransferase involved in cell wall biosynthesis
MPPEPRLHGILVTYRRPAELELSLRAIDRQTRALDELVVVDNGGDAEEMVQDLAPKATYVRAWDNLGPAGGIAIGMERILDIADDHDWVFTFDDNDWATDPELFARLVAYAERMREADPATGAVGRSGVRFDIQRGQIVRVPDSELRGPVLVDCVAGNQFPLYSVAAVRDVGMFRTELFYGFEELEFGLRLRRSGHRIYVEGELWYEGREELGRLQLRKRPARRLHREPDWKRYYSIRNLIAILLDLGHRGPALRVTGVTAVGKPLANLPRAPRLALAHLRVGLRAALDGWVGRMGRTVDPVP